MTISTFYYESPLGRIEISATDEVISSVLFEDSAKKQSPKLPATEHLSPEIEKCVLQLDDYFSGKIADFDVRFKHSGSDFQQKVWAELCRIPVGKTISYLELSKRIGNVKAIRAVGTANGCNQIGIIVPCHRVIGADGSLVGYAGDLWRKKWLLDHEQKMVGLQQLTLF